MRQYVTGPAAGLERKNGWTLAEAGRAGRRAGEDRATVERLRVQLEQTRTDHHDEVAALRREAAEEPAALRQEAREQLATVLARPAHDPARARPGPPTETSPTRTSPTTSATTS